VSLKRWLGKILLLAVLEFGAVCGVPMDPEKIENIMNMMARTRVEYVVKKDDPPE
jgi:hypothetical protein